MFARMPTERQKMLAGLPYEPWDAELMALRRKARDIPESLGRKIVDDPAAYLQLHAQLTQIAERLEA